MSQFLIRNIISNIRTLTGKRYLSLESELASLSENAIRDFNRLIRDCEHEITAEKNKMRRNLFSGRI